MKSHPLPNPTPEDRAFALVTGIALSDAAFDGRPWDGMSKADRVRYTQRAALAYEPILAALREVVREGEAKPC